MSARVATIIMAVLLAVYLVVVTQYAVVLIMSENVIATVIGVALAVLPLLGGWLLIAEITFVLRGERLVKRLGAEGELPVDDLPRLPSGRIDPVAADAEFPQYQSAVETDPGSWRAWLRLGLAYDASGDRSRARWATRRAIAIERTASG